MVSGRVLVPSATVGLVLIVSSVVAVVATSGDDSSDAAAQLHVAECLDPHLATAWEIHSFNDLAEMAVTSAWVVRATAIGAAPGRVYGADDDSDEQWLRVRDVRLSVQEVLYNRHDDPPPGEIVVEEHGWDKNGCYYQNGMTWTQVGDEVYYFVMIAGDHGKFAPVSTQGRFVFTADETLEPSRPDTELGKTAASLSPEQLERTVKDAQGKLAAGEISPQPEP